MSFFDEYRRGVAQADEIHDHIAAWHDAPIGSPAAAVDLHEFLGFTWDQYRHWVTRGELPPLRP